MKKIIFLSILFPFYLITIQTFNCLAQTVKQLNVSPKSLLNTIHLKSKHTSTDTNITFSFADTTLSCDNPSYFEFDIMATSNPNTTFNSCVIDITYSPGEFGTNIKANGGLTVSQGNDFWNYNAPTASDLAGGSSFEINFGDASTPTTDNGVVLSGTPVVILQIKMLIQSCQTSTIGFTKLAAGSPSEYTFTSIDIKDIDSTENSAGVWTVTVADTTTNYQNIPYCNTYYSADFTAASCPFQITDFTSPINAGVGDILTITGNCFGNSRGNGQVEFINADNCCSNYVQKLNATDYVSWSDNQIQIRVPNFVDSITSTSGLHVAIGGGNFIVKKSTGDSTVSANNLAGKPFIIYYNINQTRNSLTSTFEKDRINLRSTNGSGNGYTFRLNPTDFPANSNVRGIFAKAMRDWICFSGANLQIGADTTMIYVDSVSDGVNYISFSSILSPGTAASTTLRPSTCGNGTASLREADMRFNSSTTFIYDSTGTVDIPYGDMDFYGVCLHELGHVIELAHNANPNDLMFWTANSGPLTASQRKRLVEYTSPADGGLYSVVQSTSNSNIPPCGWTKMVGLNNSCNNGINEIINDDSFALYPNPSYGTFTIETKVNGYTLIITNVLGQTILSQKIQSKRTEIDISNQANGIYFILVKSNNGTAIQKLIIQK
jgi:hypothetical protein